MATAMVERSDDMDTIRPCDPKDAQSRYKAPLRLRAPCVPCAGFSGCSRLS